jgi:hypothetical protein
MAQVRRNSQALHLKELVSNTNILIKGQLHDYNVWIKRKDCSRLTIPDLKRSVSRFSFQ